MGAILSSQESWCTKTAIRCARPNAAGGAQSDRSPANAVHQDPRKVEIAPIWVHLLERGRRSLDVHLNDPAAQVGHEARLGETCDERPSVARAAVDRGQL